MLKNQKIKKFNKSMRPYQVIDFKFSSDGSKISKFNMSFFINLKKFFFLIV